MTFIFLKKKKERKTCSPQEVGQWVLPPGSSDGGWAGLPHWLEGPPMVSAAASLPAVAAQ